MKTFGQVVKATLLAAAVLIVSASASWAGDDEYSFKVENKTGTKIVKILVSEKGKEWGYFDIGSGIPSGGSETLVWAKSTNGTGCKWFFKAVFSDKSESEAVKFDFCEDDLELVFD